MVFNASLVSRCTALALLGLVCLLVDDAKAVTIAWSPVGNAGNAADPATGFGAVGYDYKIGTYDVTNAQYTDFLNAKDPTGANTLKLYETLARSFDATHGGIDFNAGAAAGNKYSVGAGMGNHPVNYVTWYDAIRFANWMNNGQGNGDTETGAYTILGGTPIPTNGDAITRNHSAHIVLPNENEWYKAAYFSPATQSYFQYATSSNIAPARVMPPGGPNSANYFVDVGTLTDVGAYTSSSSPFGTFDQSGNVNQWNETLLDIFSGRVYRGGSFASATQSISSSDRHAFGAGGGGTDIGFRVAIVPEPSTGLLALIAGTILLW